MSQIFLNYSRSDRPKAARVPLMRTIGEALDRPPTTHRVVEADELCDQVAIINDVFVDLVGQSMADVERAHAPRA
jgi:hypothetical protein